MPSTDDLWSMYGHQILKFAAPDFDPTKQQFSMASSTLSLDLGNPDPAVVNGYIYNLGNTIPAPSPCYAPGSGLFTAYQRFLDAIDLHGDTNPNLDSQINIAAANMNAAQTNFLSVQTQAITAWTAYKAVVPGISFSDYVTQQYLTYGQAKNALDATTSAWQQLMTQKYGQGYEIIANARNRLSPRTAGQYASARAQCPDPELRPGFCAAELHLCLSAVAGQQRQQGAAGRVGGHERIQRVPGLREHGLEQRERRPVLVWLL